jgi:hypothetical protein
LGIEIVARDAGTAFIHLRCESDADAEMKIDVIIND